MNEDIETFIDTHGVEKLLAFLPYLKKYRNGTTNARIVARQLDVEPIESEIVLQYLREQYDHK